MRIRQRMQRAAWRVAAVMIIGIAFIEGLSLTAAAPPDQQTLTPGAEAPVTGTLDQATPQVSYVFPCAAGGMASIYVETTSGDLMVDISVLDPTSSPFASGQIEQKNPNVSVAEAFIMPADGPCTVVLNRAGQTAGMYELRLLPGYARLEKWDAFDGAGPPLRMDWQPFLSDTMEADIRNEQLEITLMAENTLGYMLPEDKDLDWDTLYIQADFVIEGTPTYFEYGFLLRSDYDGNTFYSLTVSSDGDWSYYYFLDSWNEIQSWTVSPAIDGNDKTPRLGVLLHGDTMQLYFNDHYAGEVTDLNGFAGSGIVGIAAATGTDQSEWLTVIVDNVIVTRPFGYVSLTTPSSGDQTEPVPAAAPSTVP